VIETRIRDVRILAEQLLGEVEGVIHQPYGHAGITFEILTPSASFILKTRDQIGVFDHTEHHFATLTGLGIPTPTFLKRGTHAGFGYMLLTKIPGDDLGTVLGGMSPSQMTRLAEKVVWIERQVMTLPRGKGFGWTPMDVPGPFLSWTSVVERDSKAAPDAIRDEVAEWQGYFDGIEPICFLDDLTVKNVIVQNGELQGIVDLDEVCFGDPLYWLSLAEVTSILDVKEAGVFYGEELRRLWAMTELGSAACDLYNAIQADSFLGQGIDHPLLAIWAANRLDRARAFRLRCAH
jgi:hypothetical protein